MDYRARLNLSGRLALVTGAGQGIGAAVAEALAATGAKVICTDILLDRAEASATELRAQGYEARAEALDVTDSTAIDALAAALPPLDILVCNAGIVTNTPAEAMSDAEWDRVIAVNLTGVANAQWLVVTLTGVTEGAKTGDTSVALGVLVGDTTADGSVNSADIGQTKAAVGMPYNYRVDVNNDGVIDSSDIGLVKSKTGHGLP